MILSLVTEIREYESKQIQNYYGTSLGACCLNMLRYHGSLSRLKIISQTITNDVSNLLSRPPKYNSIKQQQHQAIDAINCNQESFYKRHPFRLPHFVESTSPILYPTPQHAYNITNCTSCHPSGVIVIQFQDSVHAWHTVLEHNNS